MTDFVGNSYPTPGFDFPYGPCFTTTASTPSSSGCLATPPSYRIGPDSPAPRSNLAFQSALSQVTDSSFFDEAISASPMSTQVSFAFPQCFPQQVAAAKFSEDSKPLHAAPPASMAEQKPPRRLRTSSQHQDVPVKLEEDFSEPIAEETKGNKRGRKPKTQRRASLQSSRSQDSDGEGQFKDPRRRRILERNRIAATKCRMRKRDEASALAQREQAMEDHNRHLSKIFDDLTAEIYHLKTQLLRHTDCNCVLIQKYIAHEARKSVSGLPPCPSPFQPSTMPWVDYQRSSSGSGTSATDSHGIRTPEMESVPTTWADPSQQSSRSPEDILDMALEPLQEETIPVPTQHMPTMPTMHSCSYHEAWVGPGLHLQPSDSVLWGSPWEV
ncbi:hypothetical protein B0T10DRAFT_148708 [Thelonectria olida]|uniref:BZIP domain-containing protein n=1 Tax=Thelonectria olida TaxID=1576542 RepID=A0A9P9AKZ1_9HYPO|nr:hypothetical protein B0T10DRAFT_148708 [Thelonectria olida]